MSISWRRLESLKPYKRMLDLKSLFSKLQYTKHLCIDVELDRRELIWRQLFAFHFDSDSFLFHFHFKRVQCKDMGLWFAIFVFLVSFDFQQNRLDQDFVATCENRCINWTAWCLQFHVVIRTLLLMKEMQQ